ncbi:MAG TPA: Gfo/Idh/MocA family oxidoreductase [Candidatus Sulfotelmatobacter sp.]|nr:Gfo/Idh/MocA family oxidoreductase [Candidatus Sulfotelmatobacter sp.]
MGKGQEPENISRRNFIVRSAMGGAGLVIAKDVLQEKLFAEAPIAAAPKSGNATMIGVPFEAHERVRLGIIGVGGRGTSLLRDLLAVDGVEVKAICDLVPDKVDQAQKMVVDVGQPKPAGFSNGDHDFKNLNQLELDIVYIATPWNWHVPMAVDVMKNGKHAAVEVPAATTLQECWEMVNTSEATRKHCVILENCCYGSSEMMVLQMVRDGAFGQITHGEGAYLHDLRGVLTANQSEGLWRRFPHMQRNGNLYPTHGLGPVAHYMDIHRGDRFDYMVSVSSPEASLSAYVKGRFPDGDPKRAEKYICGDMNTSIIKTVKGRTILVQHDVVNPRPYSRLNMIQGTKGIFADYPPRIFMDGQKDEEWQKIDSFQEKYEHPLWKNNGEMARKTGGHGGMDYIMNFRLMDCLKRGLVPDIDVYDAAAWSAPTPLSEASVAANGLPQKFPDFTRDHWQARPESERFAG